MKELVGRKILAAEAPQLPLPDCSRPLQCRCHFKKSADRRDMEDGRREQNGSMRSILYAGQERRKSSDRRRED